MYQRSKAESIEIKMKAYDIRYITKKDYEVIKRLGKTLSAMYI